MGKSHKTGGGGGHHSKKPDSAKKKDKEKDKSNKEKKVVKGGDAAKHKTQKSPKSATAKKKKGDGKSDKSKKQAKKHSGKPKSAKEKSGKEKSGKEKTSKHSKPPVPKKEETPVESGTSTADEVVDEVEVAALPVKPKGAKGGEPKKKTIDPEASDAADCSCETKQSSGGGQEQSSAAATTAAASSAADETIKKSDATSSTTEESGVDDDAEFSVPPKKKGNKSKPPKEKEKKPKSKNSPPKLEFTKPTINQMVREEERQKHPKPPLVDTPEISRYDFETFNDEVEEMNSGLQMLRSSYGSIITSLVAMYTKRGKRGQKTQLPPTVDGKANLLTPINAANEADVQEEASILNDADKYNIENFINPATRQASFDALFAEVELLNRKTEKFRSAFFDKKGYFLLEKYEAQKEMKLSRKKLNHFWLWTRKLTEVIDEIARNYNDDLLNMFRLH